MNHIFKIDTDLLLFINGLQNPTLDILFFLINHYLFWIPLFVILIDKIHKEYDKKSIYIFLMIIILITFSDLICDYLLNPSFKRLRPSHSPSLQHIIKLSNSGPGSLYGFIYKHSTNAFSLSTFLFQLFSKNNYWLKVTIFTWAILVSLGAIYIGIHFPIDILCSAFIGVLFGYFFYFLYKSIKLKNKFSI